MELTQMQRFLAGFRSVQSSGVAAPRFQFVRVTKLLAFAGILAVTPVFADDAAKPTVKAAVVKAPAAVAQAAAPAVAPAPAAPAVMPEGLEKLKLTAEQQGQVKAIVQKYDQTLATVWHQFSDHYMQTIKLETAMLAAIEDNLTDAQRTEVHSQRRHTAHHGRGHGKHAAEKEVTVTGVTLTHDQETAADKVHQKYREQLRIQNNDIHDLHARLVSLEADKLVEIEKVLTKDQLTQLRASRQAPVAAAHTEATPAAPVAPPAK
jgi:hypothetical protein